MSGYPYGHSQLRYLDELDHVKGVETTESNYLFILINACQPKARLCVKGTYR